MTERFLQLPLSMQLANIGSEFSRAMKWKGKNDEIFWSEAGRFLEYINTMIYHQKLPKHRKRELLIVRELVCDKFTDGNQYGGTVQGLQNYFDAFALIRG